MEWSGDAVRERWERSSVSRVGGREERKGARAVEVRNAQEERERVLRDGKEGEEGGKVVSKKPESSEPGEEERRESREVSASSSEGSPSGRVEMPDQERSTCSARGRTVASHFPSLIPRTPLSLSCLTLTSAPASAISTSSSSLTALNERSRSCRREVR